MKDILVDLGFIALKGFAATLGVAAAVMLLSLFM